MSSAVREHNLDSTSLDATTFETGGDESRVLAKLDTEILYTLATSSIVPGDEKDTSEGSENGVDVHTIKLPSTNASRVNTRNTSVNWVSSRWVHVGSEDGAG